MWIGKKSAAPWREQFVATARRVFPGQELSFEEGISAIRRANGLQLLAFDEWVRRGHNYNSNPGGRDAQNVIRTALGDPEHADVYLFYETCNGNGRVREQAVRALRGRDQRLIFAAILIRTGDWVPEIVNVASLLLSDVTATQMARHAFEFLDLISALRSRQRFSPQWIETLEPALLLPKWRDARRAALTIGNADARHLAHELTWRADLDYAQETLRLAIGCPELRIALWGLGKIPESSDPGVRQALLREGLRSRLAAVRSEALRRYCRDANSDLRQVLEGSVFDRSGSVRAVAAYQLNAMFNESALTRWREAYDRGNRGEALFTALAEYGDTLDELRLRPLLTHPRGRIRALGLRGLLRIAVTDSALLLEASLRDPSTHVVGAAIAGYRRGTESMTSAILREALEAGRTPGVRVRLIGASELLSKWDRLQFLLAHYAKCGDAERDAIDAAIERWIAGANRSFVEPEPRQQLVLRHAVETARATRPSQLWDKLLPLL